MNLGNAVGIFLMVSGFSLVAIGLLPATLSGQTLNYPDIPASIKMGLVFVITGMIISLMSLIVEKRVMEENKKMEQEEKETPQK